MKSQGEDLYIVVGAQSPIGACYREEIARRQRGACLGLGRRSKPGQAIWDARDKNLLWVDLCRTYDASLHQALRSFLDSRETAPARITIIFAAGRNNNESGKPAVASDRRRSSGMRCFDALALKNLASIIEDVAAARAIKTQTPVSLCIAALSDDSSAKATLEAFVGKFASCHNRAAHPYLAKSGLVLRLEAASAPPSQQAALTLPHIFAMPEGKSSRIDVIGPPEPPPRWRSPSGTNGLPDVAQWQGLMRDKEGVPRSLWSSIIRTRRVREAEKSKNF